MHRNLGSTCKLCTDIEYDSRTRARIPVIGVHYHPPTNFMHRVIVLSVILAPESLQI